MSTKRPWYAPVYIARGVLTYLAVLGGIELFGQWHVRGLWAAIATGVVLAVVFLIEESTDRAESADQSADQSVATHTNTDPRNPH